VTYRQKRADLLEDIMNHSDNGVGIRRMAAMLKTSIKTIQRKIIFLDMVCDSFQEVHMRKWKKKPNFQMDEFWSAERSRTNTLTIPIVVESNSYFIVSAQAAHTYSLSSIPSEKERIDLSRSHEISKRNSVIKKTLRRCKRMKPQGRIVIDTDKKTTYPKLLEEVFGKENLVHKKWDAQIDEEKIKLFPVNNTIACIRSEKPMLRRETWHLTKSINFLNKHLSIYTVYYNYMRKKKYSRRQNKKTLKIFKMEGDVVIPVTRKSFDHETPAMRLGIFDKPITFQYILDNCGLKFTNIVRTTGVKETPKKASA
jgi:hypothetical protein